MSDCSLGNLLLRARNIAACVMYIRMGAPSKRAKRIRQSSEFDMGRLTRALNPPRSGAGAYAWGLEEIKSARDSQMRGLFSRPARLAESMRTDDALFVARANRLAPQRCIEVGIEAVDSARAKSIAGEAEALFGAKGIAIAPETAADLHGYVVDHGVAFGRVLWTPREDGSRVDPTLRAWPIEFVRWDSTLESFVTQTDGGPEEMITHGDGAWVIFCKHEIEPFKHGAILPAALVWARHAFASRDWAKGSVAHGNAKVIGTMPDGVPLQDENGVTAQAAAFLELLQAIGSGDGPTGIKPAGSTIDFLTNNSTAWQVWNELVQNAEKAAARVYLGTDGMLGSQGGAPGVDIQALFGVASTIVEGDLECLERGFKTGLIEPWTAINFGDSTLAPTRKYLLPDPDEHSRRLETAERCEKFFAAVKAANEAGFEMTDEYIDTLAALYGVPAPKLAVKPAAPAPGSIDTTLRRVAR
jgi:hypothetical protein